MRFLRITSCLLAVLGVGPAVASAAEPLIWMEGEQAVKKQLVDNAGLNDVNPDELSGGRWICSFSHEQEPTGTAEYAVGIPEAGRYHLWVRAVGGTGLAYRLDGAKDAVDVAIDKGHDPIPVAADGNPFYPPTDAWYDLGLVDLTQGQHTITWYLGGLKEKVRWGGMDCFALTTGTFTPNGKYRPGEKSPEPIPAFQPGQAWDFVPPADHLDPAAVLDLRYLNEKAAGEHGFIRLSADGNSFLRGDGAPIRFWAASPGFPPEVDLAARQHDAQFLAKRGVNFARVWCNLYPTVEGSKITDVDEKALDDLFKTVAALKSAGIYLTINPYWAVSVKLQKSWGVTDPGTTCPEGLLFFEPTMQKGFKAWLKALYTTKNPYTGLPLGEDPAVAIIELQNEDSLLWWGCSNIKGEAQILLRRLFADFLKEKYGSLEKARQPWQNHKAWVPDEWDKGLPGLMHPWDLTRDARVKHGQEPGFMERAAAQTEFLARLMRQFNSEMAAYVREELHCKQLINANNWRTADLSMTQDAEYWADCANDVNGRNFYTGGYHKGVNDGWQILPGQYYTDVSMIKEPVNLPINVKRPVGHAFILPEMLWTPPDLYESEGPLMVAAQTALTGLDISCWFGIGNLWCDNPSYKWVGNSPVILGQFPANALIFRQGLVKAGRPAVVEHRRLEDLWERTTPIISEESGWDPNRDTGNIALTSSVKTAVDPLAYLVGAVRVAYDSDSAKTEVADLAKYIDRKNKTVRSITGQIETDYGNGIYRVNSPTAQAVAGFLKNAGPQHLADMDVACRNQYAAIVLVPLDGKTIRQSGKLLLQVGTVCRPTGWVAMPTRARIDGRQSDCFRILSAGKAPFQVENTEATVTVANSHITKAVLLDINGMATPTPVEIKRTGGKATVALPANTMYLMLSK
ncbi:MAG: hypothetical protein ACLQU3_24835 [Limisphaerales bacterium]